jgi:hypothetical protein
MRIKETEMGITLIREPDDCAISKESTVTHHIRRLLNYQEHVGKWTRFYPDREGLTSCRQGVQNKKRKIWYWHEKHQIESASQEFNLRGRVFFLIGNSKEKR